VRRINDKQLISVRLQAENQCGLRFKEKLLQKQQLIDALQTKLDEASDTNTQILKLQAEVVRIPALEREAEQLRSQGKLQLENIRALNEKSHKLESQRDAFQAEITELKREHIDLSGSVENFNTRINERDKQLDDLREKQFLVDQKNQEIESTNTQRTQELNSTRKRLVGTLENLSQSEKRVAELQREVNALNHRLSSNSEELESIQQSLKESDESRTQLSERVKSVGVQVQQVDMLTSKLQERDRDIAALTMQLNTASTQLAQRTSEAETHLLQQKNDQSEELERSKVEIDKLNRSLKSAESVASVAKQNDIEIRRLRSELQSVQQMRDGSATKVQSLEMQIKEQERKIATNAQLQERVRELESMEVDSVRRDQQIAKLNKQLLDLKNERTQTSKSSKKQSNKSKSQQPVKPLYAAPAEKDDLKKINGIGPVMEKMLYSLGVTSFKQLAEFKSDDISKVTSAIQAFPGRIERDNWVGGAKEQYQKKYSKADA